MPEKYVQDKYEQEVVKLLPQLKTKSLKKRVSILKRAASLISKSSNPESNLMRDFFYGKIKYLKGAAEKNNIKAIQFFDEALALFSRVSEENKINTEYHETIIMKHKRELELNKNNFSKSADILLEIAEEQKILGRDDQYNISMSQSHFQLKF